MSDILEIKKVVEFVVEEVPRTLITSMAFSPQSAPTQGRVVVSSHSWTSITISSGHNSAALEKCESDV
jgi:hypothetical protein